MASGNITNTSPPNSVSMGIMPEEDHSSLGSDNTPNSTRTPTMAVHQENKAQRKPTLKRHGSTQSLQSIHSTQTTTSQRSNISHRGTRSPRKPSPTSNFSQYRYKQSPDLLLPNFPTNKRNNSNPSKQGSSSSSTAEHPRISSLLGRKNVFRLFGVVFLVTCTAWLWGVMAEAATARDIQEIRSTVQSLRLSKQEEDKKLEEFMQSMNTSRKLLIVGMVETLDELFGENFTMESETMMAIATLCWAYNESNSQNTVDVHVLYKSKNVSSDGDPETELKAYLADYKCQTSLVREDDLWRHKAAPVKEKFKKDFRQLSRYKRLGKLRSEQRRQILNSEQGKDGFDMVLNVDLDVVSLPPIVPLLYSLESVADDRSAATGSIICANGFENWDLANGLLKRPLYYDTMAAVDDHGNWGYRSLTTNAREVAKFGQTLFLRDILRRIKGPDEPTELFPMRSCFGGVALYDFDTWATPECDYDRDMVQLRMDDPDSHTAAPLPIRHAQKRLGSSHTAGPNNKLDLLREFKKRTKKWTLDPKYTLNRTPDGDTCEHVVFQQCLYDANREKSTMENKRPVNVGIKPDLVIERYAAVMNRWEDFRNVAASFGELVAGLTGFSLMLFPILKYLLFPSDKKSRSNDPPPAKATHNE